MKIKIRYESFDQFFRLNSESFKMVQKARSFLKSPVQLGESGHAIIESERLAFYFLNLKSTVSDLMFGLTASVLDAKQEIKNQTALAYRETAGAQGERKIQVEAHIKVIDANEKYNDLIDLKEYLDLKYKDFEMCHYHYKQISQGKV